MKYFLTACLLATTIGFLGCQTGGSKSSTAGAAGGDTADLTWDQAKARKLRVDNVSYMVKVDLNETDKFFQGRSEIRFNLKDNKEPLRIDFFEGEIVQLMINGASTDPATVKRAYWIDVPAALLKVGENVVEVGYRQLYSTQGQGLHRFQDPETKEIFLYSQFETYDANRFMPCFDQPDLRAPLTLTVQAPASWQVITTTRETSIKKTGPNRTWSFPATPAISTYLMSLHAGPYKVWEDRFEDIPLRLFARPSMAKYMRVKEWFTYTKQGLKFFNAYFDFKYPFKKYDQLAVPEFNAGAMENVGAVTFTESFLWRAEPTRDQLRGLSSVILHEMAHMWFGDIVTMKWWNDLWLNESFATYMASLANAEATVFKEEWQDFHVSDKSWAYWEDSLITTHPIEAPVLTVKDAFANFDGITYGKGAAALKQLNAYISPEAFKAGVRKYIKAYAYKNAELSEFIGSLQGETKKDLNAWAALWLRQSGTDKLTARWSCEGARLKRVELIVTPSTGAKFRPQTVDVALFTGTTRPEVLRTDLLQPTTTLTGDWACPSFVYPNFNDHGFFIVALDRVSLEFAKKNLSRIPDKLARSMVWGDLWKMVRNTETPLKDYVATVNDHFPPEKDPILERYIVSTISGTRNDFNTILNYWPQTDDRLRTERLEFIGKMEDAYLNRMQNAPGGSDSQKNWFDAYVTLATSPKALDRLATWGEAKMAARGLKLDLDRRWNIAIKLSRFQHPKAEPLVAEMIKADTSDRGRRQSLAAEAIRPDFKVKEKWVQRVKKEKSELSYAETRAVMRALFPIDQRPLARRFAADFYKYVEDNARSENENVVETVAGGLMPLDCGPEESQRLRGFVTKTRGLNPTLAKELKVSLDEDERCQRIRAMSSL